MNSKNGVDYILKSKRPYPEWLRTHTVFKEMQKIDKIFPKIGLPNFREPCDIMNSAEALTEAQKLGNKIVYEMNSTAMRALRTKLDTVLASAEKDRNEVCGKLQSLINILNNVVYSMGFADYAKVIDGKVVMRLRADVFGEGKTPVFRKDEAILRVANKIWDMCAEHKVELAKLDQLQEFKDFSRVNVPNKKYMLVFSSYGDEGSWDISTISMRGVTSCQSWNAPQSRGLIGSVSSKFVGVIYLASDQEIPGYGSKMLNRAMVRFAIHKNTKKPALILDRMYPNHNIETMRAFRKTLADKSGLDVISTVSEDGRQAVAVAEYYIPEEISRKYLKQGEFSYMDHQIPIQAHAPVINKTPVDLLQLTNEFKKKVSEDLRQSVKLKRQMYVRAIETLEKMHPEYDAAKKKWEEENLSKPEQERSEFGLEKPKLDPALASFAKEGASGKGILNLLTHCDKKHGADSAGHIFAKVILDSFEVPQSMNLSSKEEYHRKYLMTFLKDSKKIKEEAKKKMIAGSWMKSFPKSAEKFFDYTFSQMRSYMIDSCREMIKALN